jgi:hypothetical protein
VYPHTSLLYDILITSDDKTLIVVGYSIITLWNIETNEKIREIHRPEDYNLFAELSSDD